MNCLKEMLVVVIVWDTGRYNTHGANVVYGNFCSFNVGANFVTWNIIKSIKGFIKKIAIFSIYYSFMY